MALLEFGDIHENGTLLYSQGTKYPEPLPVFFYKNPKFHVVEPSPQN